MKPDRAVLRETARVAVGVFALVGVMLVVYAIIGRLSAKVALGGVYTGLLTVLNFFVMGLTVQGVTDRAAEKER
ncbi:MAG: ATP synthase subunit I, partial [bacterium]